MSTASSVYSHTSGQSSVTLRQQSTIDGSSVRSDYQGLQTGGVKLKINQWNQTISRLSAYEQMSKFRIAGG